MQVRLNRQKASTGVRTHSTDPTRTFLRVEYMRYYACYTSTASVQA